MIHIDVMKDFLIGISKKCKKEKEIGQLKTKIQRSVILSVIQTKFFYEWIKNAYLANLPCASKPEKFLPTNKQKRVSRLRTSKREATTRNKDKGNFKLTQ